MNSNHTLERINEILTDAMETVVSNDEINKNVHAQNNFTREIEECYRLLENVDLGCQSGLSSQLTSNHINSNSSNDHSNGNMDMMKIKQIIEQCMKESMNGINGSHHEHGHMHNRLNNIDEKLDELATRITGHPISSEHERISLANQESDDLRKAEMEDIRKEMLDEFRDLKNKMVDMLDNKSTKNFKDKDDDIMDRNDNSHNNYHGNDDDNDEVYDNSNDRSYVYNKIHGISSKGVKHSDVLDETALLKEKLNNFVNKTDYTNELVLQRMNMLSDKLNNLNYGNYGNGNNMTPGHSPQMIHGENVMNKLKKIGRILEKQEHDDEVEEEKKDNKDIEDAKEIVMTVKEKTVNNANDADAVADTVNAKKDVKKADVIVGNNKRDNENVSVNMDDFDLVAKSKEKKKNNKYVFTKSKDPFKYIYNNTDDKVFRKIEMAGGGGVDGNNMTSNERLRELRKSAIKLKTKKQR